MKQISRVYRLPQEPVVVIRNQGTLTPALYDFRITCAAVASTMEAHHMPYTYLISDDRGLRIPDFDSFAMVIADALQNVRGPGSPSDPRVRGGAIVATHEGMRIWSDLLNSKDFYGLMMPVFESMEDALAFVRRRLRTDTGLTQRASSETEAKLI